jgi:hypothetical protein
MTQFDFAKLPSQIDRRTAIQTMMQTPQETVVTYDGRPMLVSDALKHMMKGEGVAYEPAPEPQAPGRGSIRIDPARLNEQQRTELEQTGNLAGFTSSDRGRAMISVRNSSGTVQSRFSFDPETGKVEQGRPMDLRDFDAPEGSK